MPVKQYPWHEWAAALGFDEEGDMWYGLLGVGKYTTREIGSTMGVQRAVVDSRLAALGIKRRDLLSRTPEELRALARAIAPIMRGSKREALREAIQRGQGL